MKINFGFSVEGVVAICSSRMKSETAIDADVSCVSRNVLCCSLRWEASFTVFLLKRRCVSVQIRSVEIVLIVEGKALCILAYMVSVDVVNKKC